MSAVWNVAYDLGWGVGAAAVGLLVTSVGIPVAFAATAAAAVAMLPLARSVGHRRSPPAQELPEVRHREGDPAALAGVDEALLDQAVAGG